MSYENFAEKTEKKNKKTRAARGGKDFEKFLIFWSGLRCLRVFNSRGEFGVTSYHWYN